MPRGKNKSWGNNKEPTPGYPDHGNERSDRKYGRRRIQSNWERYGPENLEGESANGKKANDFADLVNSPSDCNYFRFKSEKNWESEAACGTLSCQKFFNLDLDVLSHGLACLPFYERIDIDKSILSQSDIERCDEKAKKSLLNYKKMREEFMKKLNLDYKLSGIVEDVSEIALGPREDPPQVIHTNTVDVPPPAEAVPQSFQGAKNLVADKTDPEENVKENKTEEENFEEWLDSILDD